MVADQISPVLWDASAQGRPATEDGGSDVEGSLSDVEDEAAVGGSQASVQWFVNGGYAKYYWG